MHRPIVNCEGSEAARAVELGGPERADADQDLNVERFDQSTHVLVCDALLARSNMTGVDQVPYTDSMSVTS